MAKRLTKEDKWDRALHCSKMIIACMDGLKSHGMIDCERSEDWFTFIIAQWIYGQPFEVTNYMSKSLIESLEAGSKKICFEHFFGRKGSGRLIYKKVKAGHSAERIAAIMRSRSRVHRVTSAENNRLAKLASPSPFKSKAQIQKDYELAGVQLIYVPPKNTMYIIDDVEYSKDEAMEKFDIDYDTLYYRANYKGKKWKSWQKKENQ